MFLSALLVICFDLIFVSSFQNGNLTDLFSLTLRNVLDTRPARWNNVRWEKERDL